MTVPEAVKPREVVCFFPVEFPTLEGDVYLFTAKDAYSQFLFQTGVEKDNGIDQVLKHLALLMKEKDFARFGKQPFTLVMHKHQEHKTQIEQVIAPYGGTVVFDDPYLTLQMVDVIEHLYKSLAERSGKNG